MKHDANGCRRVFDRRDILLHASSIFGLICTSGSAFAKEGFPATGHGTTTSDVRNSLPRASDVILSVRSKRPHDLEALSAFRATRCEWTYSTDPAYVAALKSRVPHVGLAISPSHFPPGGEGGAIDIDGSDLTAPWFVAEGAPWKSLSRPEGRRSIMKLLSDTLAAGADSIQIDDPSTNFVLTVFAGGDFSREAIVAFERYVSTDPRRLDAVRGEFDAHGRDMGRWVAAANGGDGKVAWPEFKKKNGNHPLFKLWVEFSKSVTVAFLQEIRHLLHTSDRPIPLSLNIPDPLPVPLKAFFLDNADYLISEVTSPDHPCETFAQSACVRAWDIPFVPSLVPVSVPNTRWYIALAYALGDRPLVPWATYVPNKPRYFGTPEEYGALFTFVRDHAAVFDEYDVVTEVMLVVSEATSTKKGLYDLVKIFTDRGLNVDFCILRTDGSTTVRTMKTTPELVIAPTDAIGQAKSLFPRSRVRTPAEIVDEPESLVPLLRATTTLGDRVVAVPRTRRQDGTLAVHVVDTRQSGDALPDDAELVVELPHSHRHSGEALDSVGIVGPSRASERRPASRTPNGHGMTLRVPLAGLREWAIVVLPSARSTPPPPGPQKPEGRI